MVIVVLLGFHVSLALIAHTPDGSCRFQKVFKGVWPLLMLGRALLLLSPAEKDWQGSPADVGSSLLWLSDGGNTFVR